MKTQQGSVMIMVIIVMISMLMISLALLRSSETVNHMTSTITFHEAAKKMGDVGIYQALNALVNNNALDTAIEDAYYPTILDTDANGLPEGIDWEGAPTTTMNNNYNISYVIERMCSGTVPITNPEQQCIAVLDEDTNSKKLGAPVYVNTDKFHYRITVLVRGPKNTEVYVQAIVTR